MENVMKTLINAAAEQPNLTLWMMDGRFRDMPPYFTGDNHARDLGRMKLAWEIAHGVTPSTPAPAPIDPFPTCWMEVTEYPAPDAYIRDLRFSSVWADGDVPQERIDWLRKLWICAHSSPADLIDAIMPGASARAFAHTFGQRPRTVQCWVAGSKVLKLPTRALIALAWAGRHP